MENVNIVNLEPIFCKRYRKPGQWRGVGYRLGGKMIQLVSPTKESVDFATSVIVNQILTQYTGWCDHDFSDSMLARHMTAGIDIGKRFK